MRAETGPGVQPLHSQKVRYANCGNIQATLHNCLNVQALGKHLGWREIAVPEIVLHPAAQCTMELSGSVPVSLKL